MKRSTTGFGEWLRRFLVPQAIPAAIIDSSPRTANEPAIGALPCGPSERVGRSGVESPSFVPANVMGDIVRIDEVQDGNYYAGNLFRRRFGSDPPNYGRHFVAFYQPWPQTIWPVGYVHYMAFEDSWLCGGLVIDDYLYRRMSQTHRRVVKSAGGIAEALLKNSFLRITHAPAIWAYVGDIRSQKVTVRAGFRRTGHPHVMVVWNRELPEEEKEQRYASVVAFGPF